MKAFLVSAKELHGRNLDGSVQIFDCRFALNDPDAGRAAFEGRRIPGANYVDLEKDLSGTIEPIPLATHFHCPMPGSQRCLIWV